MANIRDKVNPAHSCNHEEDWGLFKANISNMSKKIDDIHGVLHGDQGLVKQFWQFKGGFKFAVGLGSFLLTVLGLCIAAIGVVVASGP